MTNLEGKFEFCKGFLTEEELENCLYIATMMTSPTEAVNQGLDYLELLNRNLFPIVFEAYKRKYNESGK